MHTDAVGKSSMFQLKPIDPAGKKMWKGDGFGHPEIFAGIVGKENQIVSLTYEAVKHLFTSWALLCFWLTKNSVPKAMFSFIKTSPHLGKFLFFLNYCQVLKSNLKSDLLLETELQLPYCVVFKVVLQITLQVWQMGHRIL